MADTQPQPSPEIVTCAGCGTPIPESEAVYDQKEVTEDGVMRLKNGGAVSLDELFERRDPYCTTSCCVDTIQNHDD